MVYEPVKSGRKRRTPIARTIRNAQTGKLWTRILTTRSPDFWSVILIGSTHRGEAKHGIRSWSPSFSQPDEVALSKAEARDWTHITQKQTVRKGETLGRRKTHVRRGSQVTASRLPASPAAPNPSPW